MGGELWSARSRSDGSDDVVIHRGNLEPLRALFEIHWLQLNVNDSMVKPKRVRGDDRMARPLSYMRR